MLQFFLFLIVLQVVFRIIFHSVPFIFVQGLLMSMFFHVCFENVSIHTHGTLMQIFIPIQMQFNIDGLNTPNH